MHVSVKVIARVTYPRTLRIVDKSPHHTGYTRYPALCTRQHTPHTRRPLSGTAQGDIAGTCAHQPGSYYQYNHTAHCLHHNCFHVHCQGHTRTPRIRRQGRSDRLGTCHRARLRSVPCTCIVQILGYRTLYHVGHTDMLKWGD